LHFLPRVENAEHDIALRQIRDLIFTEALVKTSRLVPSTVTRALFK